ncbi:MAG TPA: nuclear transport factor 2 family protein [Fodinibius sp.]|nr:nuclear transport factor 2 family protein [Fodinibius sp.]
MRLSIPPSEKTEQILINHLEAFAKGNIDGIMDDFAKDAVFYKPDGVLRGRDQIKKLFEGLMEDMPLGSDIQVKQQFIDGQLAYLFWSGESEKVKIPYATHTMIVRNGKIIKQTFAAQILNKT